MCLETNLDEEDYIYVFKWKGQNIKCSEKIVARGFGSTWMLGYILVTSTK